MNQPNILLVVIDTLRNDHLGCYKYFRNTTPNMDQIAKDGIVFEDFYNAGAPTGPAFTSIYTGLYPIHHKYYRFTYPNVRELDDLTFTMPEIFKTLGYTTVALDNLSNFPPHSKHWTRGYNHYINPNKNFNDNILAEDLNKKAIPWIKNHSDEKFFFFIHYWDPHITYDQPTEYRKIFHHKKGDYSDLEVKNAPAGYQYVPGWGKIGEMVEEKTNFRGMNLSIDLYDGEIYYLDHAIGRIISALKDVNVFDDTLVIITSDHGENLMQHYNFWGHNSLHDTVIHIPLIMRYPKKFPKNVKVKGFGQHIDLLPTILDIVGAPTGILEIDGKSLLPLLKGDKIRDTIFMEHSSGQRAIRTKEWKFITDEWLTADEWVRRIHRPPELFNVKEDPMESINLANTNIEMMTKLREELIKWIKNNLEEGKKDPAIYEDKKIFNSSFPQKQQHEQRKKKTDLLATIQRVNHKKRKQK
jgi:arylsulfatase A-like enzyme